ncbi:MAG: flavodoxin domain-containing protein, partial [Candidatus Lokiarchaeota archaeon]|nr:flavodoxin domain-containing protein [Candidatus Lokiarchaeota archaeon]
MSKVLILYGTRYGATKEISDEIEKVIQDKGMGTVSFNLKEVNPKNIPPLDQYNGIIIGTGIKMGMWTKQVKSFVQKRKAELKKKQASLGFYVCCGEAQKDINTAIEKYVNPKLEKVGIKSALIDAFGGVYDLREGSPISGMTRKIIIASLKEDP